MKFAAINIFLLNLFALSGFAEEFSILETSIQKVCFDQNVRGSNNRLLINVELQDKHISDEAVENARNKLKKNVFFCYKNEQRKYKIISKISIFIGNKELDVPKSSYEYLLDPNFDLMDFTVFQKGKNKMFKVLIGCSDNECHHAAEIIFTEERVISSSVSTLRELWIDGKSSGKKRKEVLWTFHYVN
jgi:hypothetical protein